MQTLVLLGSGEFTDAMNEIDDQLISSNNIKSITVTPTAAGKEKDAYKWIERAESHFKKFNINVIGLEIYKAEDVNKGNNLNIISGSEFIYFSGGDPGYLNSIISSTPLKDKILDLYSKGTIIAGSSAGAMVMGSKILTNPQSLFIGKSKFEHGLGLVDYQIIPHFNLFSRFAGLGSLKKIKENKNTLGIDEDTAMIIKDKNNVEVKGKGSIYIFSDVEIKYSSENFVLNK